MTSIQKRFLLALAAALLFFHHSSDALEIIPVEKAVAIAVANNPGLRISRAEVDVSASLVRQTKAPLYPRLSGKVVVPFVGRESGFYIDQMLWDFGKTRSRIKSSERYLEASRHAFAGDRAELERDTQIAYYTALAEKNRIPEAETKTERMRQLLEKAEELFAAGRKSAGELNRAKLDLREAELELMSRKNSYEIAMLNLANIMNDPDLREFEITEDLSMEKVTEDRERLVRTALAENPRIKSLLSRRVGIRASLGEAKGKFLPSVFGRAAYRFEGAGAETPAFIAGVGIKIPIFEGFSRFGEMSQSRAELARNEAETEALKSRIALSVKELHMNLGHLEEKTRILEASKSISEDNLRVAKEKYEARSTSKMELAEARALYLKAVSDYKNSIYEYKITRLRLLAMCGKPMQ